MKRKLGRLFKSIILADWLIFLASLAAAAMNFGTLWQAFLYDKYGMGTPVPVELVKRSFLIFVAGSGMGLFSFMTILGLAWRAFSYHSEPVSDSEMVVTNRAPGVRKAA